MSVNANDFVYVVHEYCIIEHWQGSCVGLETADGLE